MRSTHEPLPMLSVRTTTATGAALPGSCWTVRAPDQQEGGFDLCDGDDGTDDGTALIGTLDPGDYVLVPTIVPDGYRHIADQPFTLGDTDETLTFALGEVVRPENVSAPTVTGSPAVGTVLSGDLGTWSGTDLVFNTTWQRCSTAGDACADVARDVPTYTVASDDIGYGLRFVVLASNELGVVSVPSSVVPVVALPTGGAPYVVDPPYVHGVAKVGNALEAFPGHWVSFAGALTFTYRWERCAETDPSSCAPIPGAATDSYSVQQADEHARLRIVVTATDVNGTGTATSGPTSPVPVLRPVNVRPPAVRGTLRVGRTVTADAGRWKNTEGLRIAYHWDRCDTAGDNCVGVDMDYHGDARDANYTITRDDVGHTLRVVVWADNPDGSTYAVSPPTDVVTLYPPVNRKLPSVRGTIRVGAKVVGHVGSWGPNNVPMSFRWHWDRCDTAGDNCVGVDMDYYGDARDATYTITRDDVGHTLRVVVWADNPDGSTYAVSPPTDVVTLYPPVNRKLPSVRGTIRVGAKVVGHVGSWGPNNVPMSFRWHWDRCDTAGDNCVGVDMDYYGDARDATYTITRDDVGHTLRVVVWADNADGSTYAVSSPTPVVAG